MQGNDALRGEGAHGLKVICGRHACQLGPAVLPEVSFAS